MFVMTYPSIYVLAFCALASIALAQNQTTPAPTPPTCVALTAKPVPTTQKYAVEHCIVAQFAGYLTIGPGKFVDLTNGVVDNNASQCEAANTDPKIVIKFDCATLGFIIGKNGTKTFVKGITGLYTVNGTATPIVNTSELFGVSQSGHYYKCNSEQSIPVKDQDHHLVLSNFALEAFRTATGTEFYQIPEECALDVQPVSDLVRIGVGVCLVALVVIVLIAYFIGRRRWSERSSYESV